MSSPGAPLAPRLFLVAGLVATGVCLGVLAAGSDYYSLPAGERPHHTKHALLRPSGPVGLSCGVGGAALFLLNLTYLFRKRLLSAAWMGALRSWMAFHVLSGLSGAALVAVHTALLPRSALGILALGGLGVVIATGLVGRYLYAQLPRTPKGLELDSDELRRRLEQYRAQLEECGLDPGPAVAPPTSAARDGTRGLLSLLAGVFVGNRDVRRNYGRFAAAVRRDGIVADLAAHVLSLAHRFCQDQQRLARYGDLRSLMGSWRFLHRWLAILMLALVAFHIFLAVRFGDLWLLK